MNATEENKQNTSQRNINLMKIGKHWFARIGPPRKYTNEKEIKN